MIQEWLSQHSAKVMMSIVCIPLFGGETKLNIRRKFKKEGSLDSFPMNTRHANKSSSCTKHLSGIKLKRLDGDMADGM